MPVPNPGGVQENPGGRGVGGGLSTEEQNRRLYGDNPFQRSFAPQVARPPTTQAMPQRTAPPTIIEIGPRAAPMPSMGGYNPFQASFSGLSGQVPPSYAQPSMPGGGGNERDRNQGTNVAGLPMYGPPLPSMGGGGYGGQQQQQQGQEPWVGSFGNYQNWAGQFQAEHGRAPGEQDYYDLVDSQNFLQQTGRAPSQREWLNRYYTGTWSGTGGGGGYGGGGGGRGYGGYSSSMPAGWTPGMYFWNYGR